MVPPRTTTPLCFTDCDIKSQDIVTKTQLDGAVFAYTSGPICNITTGGQTVRLVDFVVTTAPSRIGA